MTAAESSPAFGPGTPVVVTTVSERYKRRPAYAEAARGVVDRVHGSYRPPGGDDREYLYAVRFDPAELWADAEANGAVYVDVWEGALAVATDGDPEVESP